MSSDTSVPDTSAPDTSAPDTSAPDTSAPDTKPADTKPADTKPADTTEQQTPSSPSSPGKPSSMPNNAATYLVKFCVYFFLYIPYTLSTKALELAQTATGAGAESFPQLQAIIKFLEGGLSYIQNAMNSMSPEQVSAVLNEKLQSVLSALKAKLSPFVASFDKDFVVDYLKALFGFVVQNVSAVVEYLVVNVDKVAVVDYLKALFGLFVQHVSAVIEYILQKVLGSINKEAVMQYLNGVYDYVVQKLGDFATWLWDGLKTRVPAALEQIRPYIRTEIHDFVSDLFGKIQDAMAEKRELISYKLTCVYHSLYATIVGWLMVPVAQTVESIWNFPRHFNEALESLKASLYAWIAYLPQVPGKISDALAERILAPQKFESKQVERLTEFASHSSAAGASFGQWVFYFFLGVVALPARLALYGFASFVALGMAGLSWAWFMFQWLLLLVKQRFGLAKGVGQKQE